MRYFIEFSYNGKNYHGWQSQPNAVSIQQVLEGAISTLLREKIALTGAGRTDAGVHSKQLFAHFDFSQPIDNQLVRKLNSFLPRDIAVHQIFQVTDTAHARFDAVKRTYHYYISTEKNPFFYEGSMYLNLPLNIKKMNEAAEILLGYTDFQCFSKSNTDVKTYDCKIYEAFWQEKPNCLIFSISADRFLRNMVRAIVGTLLEVGLGKISISDFKQIIELKNRSNAGASVPACGLYLMKVEYPETIFVAQK